MSEHNLLAIEMAEEAKGPRKWRRTRCRLCELRGLSPDRRGNWAVNVDTGYWHCFRCHARGFLPGHEAEVERPLRCLQLWNVDSLEPACAPDIGVPEEYVPLNDPGIQARSARAYARQRGISERIIDAARLGVGTGALSGRVIVPIYAPDDRTWVGWSARLFVDTDKPRPKYRYPDDMPRARILYNQAALSVETPEPLICVEGVFDALPYYPHVCAFLGKPTTLQRDLLLEAKRPVVICLDGDAWHEGAMFAIALRLLGKPDVASVRLPAGKDPNTVPVWQLRREALRALEELAPAVQNPGTNVL